ncbi:MAG: 4Fe-4S dicluster domain-containing protein [Anaerovoracaceae bacterium]
MQITDTVKNCNGCEACVVGCKYTCIKMEKNEDGTKYPVVNENGCQKCNACKLFCPIYNPVELPEFEDFFEYKEEFYNRDMAAVYRETKRSLKSNQRTEFVGTLCQIAALKSLMGDKLSHHLVLFPLHCDKDNPKREECKTCIFYK